MLKKIITRFIPFLVMAVIVSPDAPDVLKWFAWVFILGMVILGGLLLYSEQIIV